MISSNYVSAGIAKLSSLEKTSLFNLLRNLPQIDIKYQIHERSRKQLMIQFWNSCERPYYISFSGKEMHFCNNQN